MFLLKIVKGRELTNGARAELPLPAPPARVAIGRDPHAEWPLADPSLALSARHCEIVVGDQGVVLRDTSTNGTFVNGARGRLTRDHRLAAGDEFDLGPYRIAVHALEPAAVDLDLRTGAVRVPPVLDDEVTPPPTAHAALDDTPSAAPFPPALLAALADGLGVDPAALAGRDPVELVQRTAQIAGAAVTGLRRLLEQEARAYRRLGSRQAIAQPVRDASPLRLARTPDEALLRLLSDATPPADAVHDACLELRAHHEGLQVAFAGAARRLALDLEPASLEAALGGTAGAAGSDARKAALWDLYVALWQRLGIAPDDPWTRGFIDAAMVHLAAAYDEGVQERRAAGDASTPPV